MFSDFIRSIENMFPLTGKPKKDVEIMKERWAYLQCKTEDLIVDVLKEDPCYECNKLSMDIPNHEIIFPCKSLHCRHNGNDEFEKSFT